MIDCVLHVLLVPDDGGKTKDFLSNSSDTVVRVTVWRPPVLGQTSAGRVVDDLHRPSELAEEFLVGLGGHVWVSPCVHGNVALEFLESPEELGCVVQDVNTDHKVGSWGIMLVQEIIQRVGRL